MQSRGGRGSHVAFVPVLPQITKQLFILTLYCSDQEYIFHSFSAGVAKTNL